jgi:hypothetical protein
MTPTMQLVLVGVLVAASAVYVARAAWKTWFGKTAAGCDMGCGKCTTPALEPKQDGRFPLPQL